MPRTGPGTGLGKDAATKNRVVRVSDEVWDAAKTKAARSGETISDVIRRALVEYADLDPSVRALVGRSDR